MRVARRTSQLALMVMLGSVLAFMVPATQASDSYQPGVRASLTVEARSPIRVGSSSPAVARVSSDTQALDGDTRDGQLQFALASSGTAPQGVIHFEIAGEVIDSVRTNRNGVARTTVPARVLPKGTHTLKATYVPDAGSGYLTATARTQIEVRDSAVGPGTEDGPKAGQTPSGGLLPNTGGFWWWLLLAAAVALGTGYYLVRRAREAEPA
ncbi:Ig-like domain-containing protein [Nocardioides limicola]|uniref:Ig-like domain-containing protein n=1 Tax=Nocardioides limicola TaxID=2803368 RepID=UPI00193BBCA9|nr:Ig-like domain-containing protein [Nocardioides sp. DJM-14]